jgi:pyruvate dehydrogenase E2 component (dihydrolipoamide acetyltransferase)
MEEIKVPDLGGFEGVEVIEVSVAVGDSVEVDDAIFVVETDKATMEIPAPAVGKITGINVKEGDKVSEGDVVALMEVVSGSQVSSEPDRGVEEVKAPSPPPISAPSDAPTDAAEQTHSVFVPDLGGFSSVEVIEVSVEVGQQVEEDDTLLVLETDKATMEIPSPISGKLTSIHTSVGDKLSEGDLVAEIFGYGENSQGVQNATESVRSASNKDEGTQTQASIPKTSEEKVKVHSLSADSSKDEAKAKAASGTRGVGSSATEKVYAGPSVRKLAREFGVDLPDVLTTTGASGPRQRLLQEDIQNYVKHRLNETPREVQSGMGIEPIPEIDFSRFGSIKEEKLSRIQKISSQHLHRCWLNVPHVTQFDEVDITDLEAFRKNVNAEGSYDTKLTLLPFLVKAVQKVLQEMPRFNASLAADGETLIVKEYYHIGVAVDTNDGLMVPVVKDVDTKSILNIASDCMQYAQQARAGKLKPDALQGSCFSISSLGGIGGTQFTPIVNAPEVAILGVSKASLKPVWQDDGWQPRLILPIALSYDHRVIDGVLAAKFTTRLKQLLEDSRHLLL